MWKTNTREPFDTECQTTNRGNKGKSRSKSFILISIILTNWFSRFSVKYPDIRHSSLSTMATYGNEHHSTRNPCILFPLCAIMWIYSSTLEAPSGSRLAQYLNGRRMFKVLSSVLSVLNSSNFFWTNVGIIELTFFGEWRIFRQLVFPIYLKHSSTFEDIYGMQYGNSYGLSSYDSSQISPSASGFGRNEELLAISVLFLDNSMLIGKNNSWFL